MAALVQWAACAATFILLSWQLPAGAQVVRCTDPATGRITYTDEACAEGSKSTEIEARKSGEELARDQARIDAALRAKAERQAREREQRLTDAQTRALEAASRPAPAISSSADSNTPPAQSATIEPGYVSYYYTPAYPVYPVRPMRPPPPPRPAPVITGCNALTCYDARGNTYPRLSPGQGPAPSRNMQAPPTCRTQGGRAPC